MSDSNDKPNASDPAAPAAPAAPATAMTDDAPVSGAALPGSRASQSLWSSRTAFVLAATGSAVGLGNIWSFPYLAGEHGGGAFVMVYLVCVLLIGLPIMMAEIMLGRAGRGSPVHAMAAMARLHNKQSAWQFVGVMGVITAFIILAFYSVVAGWMLAYAVRMVGGVFEGQLADGVSGIAGRLTDDPERMLAWHTIFMVMTAAVIARGVEHGLERFIRWFMPLLFVLLLGLVIYATTTDGFLKAVNWLLLEPDFSQLTTGSVLAAMGQAFFSLSLGMGAIMMYGAYLPRDTNIPGAAATITVADTLVAILAGLAVFPIVFANGMEPAQGTTLVLQTLPLAFGSMEGGTFIGTLFFALLSIAAWTSAVSLIEPVVAWMVESGRFTRVSATTLASAVIWFLGAMVVLTMAEPDFQFSFEFAGNTESSGLFSVFEVATYKILLPLGGLLIAVFAAWVLSSDAVRKELGLSDNLFFLWRSLAGLLAPLAVLIILLGGLNAF